jgi:predicted esterase
MHNEVRTIRKRQGKGLIIGGLAFLGLLGVGTVALASGGSSEPPPLPPDVPKPPPVPDVEPEPKPDPNPPAPPAPPPPGALEFDLSTNWGGIPVALRKELARIELAALIPGLARALGVKAWQAFRAGKVLVGSVAEATAIAAANPELCRLCFNPNDATQSKALLDLNIKAGWPKPADYDGWASGAFGLFDLLGATAVYAGIHTEKNAKTLPLMQVASAKETMKRYDAQGFAASYVVRRLLVSDKYSVLKPGPNAAAGDSLQTWGNIFSAYAGPDNYAKANQEAIDAKARYLGRATEIGINLAEVAYPWPPGTTYKAPTWTAGQVWQRLQDYKNRDVVDSGGGVVEEPPAKDPVVDKAPTLFDLTDGIKALVVEQVAHDADVPLFIVLHGRDADEQQLRSSIPADLPARFAFLRAPSGRWYDAASGSPGAILAPQINTAADSVAGAIGQLRELYPTTKVLVLGYSQGASVAYRLAADDIVDGAIAVAGFLPVQLAPKGAVSSQVWAVHGDGDKNVALAKGASAYESFIFKADVQGLTIVPGGDHGLASLRPAVKAVLAKAVKA